MSSSSSSFLDMSTMTNSELAQLRDQIVQYGPFFEGLPPSASSSPSSSSEELSNAPVAVFDYRFRLPPSNDHLHLSDYTLRSPEENDSWMAAIKTACKTAEKCTDDVVNIATRTLTMVEFTVADKISDMLMAIIDVSRHLAGQYEPVCEICVQHLVRSVMTGIPFNIYLTQEGSTGLMLCRCLESTNATRKLVSYLFLNRLLTGQWSLGMFDANKPAGKLLEMLKNLGFYLTSSGEIVEKTPTAPTVLPIATPVAAQSGAEVVVANKDQPVSHTGMLWKLFKTFMPGITITNAEFDELAAYARKMSTTVAYGTTITVFLTGIVAWVTSQLTVTPAPEEITAFIKQADELLPVYENEEGFHSLQNILAKHCHERRTLYALLKVGISLSQNLGILKTDRTHKADVDKRVDRLRALVSKAVPSFVGTEKKAPPFVFYVHGPAGQGKTELKNFLFKDLFQLLGLPPFQHSMDVYAYNPIAQFWDGYNHQPVVVFEDYMQINDKATLLSEVNSLIHIADSSAYNLNMAWCESKGTMFFTSDFVFMSSNVNLSQQTTMLGNLMADPQALFRRIDITMATRLTAGPTIGRDRYEFIIDGKTCNYQEMLMRVYHAVRAKQEHNEIFRNIDDLAPDVLETIKNSSPVAVGGVRCSNCLYGSVACPTCLNCHPDGPMKFRIGREIVSWTTFHQKYPFSVRCNALRCKDCDRCPLCTEMYEYHYQSMCGPWYRNEAQSWKMTYGNTSIEHICTPTSCRKPPKSVLLTDFYRVNRAPIVAQSGEDEDVLQGAPEYAAFVASRTPSIAPPVPSTSHAPVPPLAVPVATTPFQRFKQMMTGGWGVEGIVDYLKWLWNFVKTWSSRLARTTYFYAAKACLWIGSFFSNKLSSIHRIVSRTTLLQKVGAVVLGAVAGIAAFFSIKNWWQSSPSTSIPQAQGFANESGAMGNSSFPRRFLPRIVDKLGMIRLGGHNARVDLKAMAQAGGVTFDHTVYLKNLAKVSRENFHVTGVFLKDHILMFPQHILHTDGNLTVMFSPSGFSHVSFTFNIADVPSVYCIERHLVFVDLSLIPAMRCVPMRKNILSKFVDPSTLEKDANGVMLTFSRGANGSIPLLRSVGKINNVPQPISIYESSTKTTYTTEVTIMYQCESVKGDCGALVFVGTPNGEKICGVHIAGATSYEAYAATVTDEFLRLVMEQLSSPLPVALAQSGKIIRGLDNRECVSVLGALPAPLMHMSNHTQILPSPYFESPTMSQPAALKGTFGEDGMTPLELSMSKYPAGMPDYDEAWLQPGIKWLSDFYNLCSERRRKLTLEEAIFGIEEDPYLGSIDGATSIGYHPLFSTKKHSRKTLISLVKRFVHPDLLSAIEEVEELLRSRKRPVFLCVDLLKDERLPIEKVVSGRSRVFTVLPLHINLLLKQYFGGFCALVCAAQNNAPVKVGMSIKQGDVENFARYLKIDEVDRKFLCGDIKSSDRVIPYGVFMMLVEMVNGWYMDEWQDERRLLAQAVFSPLHVADATVYQSFRGMPSGCYLTAVFNSLAYGVLLASGLHDACQLSWARVAVFGDDLVVSLPGVSEYTNGHMAAWLRKFDIEYTSPYKDRPLEDYVPASEVVFLQRKFVRIDGIRRFPMPIERVIESAKWARHTAETRLWSRETLEESIMERTAIELVLHGRTVYDTVMAKLQGKSVTRRLYVNKYDYYLSVYTDILERMDLPSGFPTANDPSFIAAFTANDECPPVSITLPECQSGEIECPINEGTRIEDDAAHVLDVGITRVEDFGAPIYYGETVKKMGVVNGAYKWPAGEMSSFDRLFSMEPITIPTSDPTNMPFHRICVFDYLLSQDYVTQRLANARFVRADVSVVIRVIATKFSYGAVMVVPRPWYSENQSVSRVRSINTTFRRYWPVSGYDNIWTASMNPHTIVSLTSSAPHNLLLEWQGPFDFLDRKEFMGEPTDLTARPVPWLLDFYQLTPALPVDLDKPQIQISLSLKNVELYNFMNLPSPADFVGPESYWSTTCPISKPRIGDVISGQFLSTWSEPAIMAQSGGDEAAQQSKPGFWSRTARFLGTIAAPFSLETSTIAYFVSDVLAYFGLSNPANPAKPSPVATTNLPTGHSIGLSPAVNSSYDVSNEMPQIPLAIVPETSIDVFCQRPMYLTTLMYRKRNTFFLLEVEPRMGIIDDGSQRFVVPMPAAYLASQFLAFRGIFQLHFQMYASAMINARFHIAVISDGTAQATSSLAHFPGWYVEASGDLCRTFVLPFSVPKVFASHSRALFGIQITLVSDIVTTEAPDVVRPVAVVLFGSWLGAQFYQPGPSRNNNANVVLYPQASFNPTPAPPPAPELPPILAQAGNDDPDASGVYCTPKAFHRCKAMAFEKNLSVVSIKPCLHGMVCVLLYCHCHHLPCYIHEGVYDCCSHGRQHLCEVFSMEDSPKKVFVSVCEVCGWIDSVETEPLIICQAGEVELPLSARDRSTVDMHKFGPSDVPASLLHLCKRATASITANAAGQNACQFFSPSVAKDDTNKLFSWNGSTFQILSMFFKYYTGGIRVGHMTLGAGSVTMINCHVWEDADAMGKLDDPYRDYFFAGGVVSNTFRSITTIPYRHTYPWSFTISPSIYVSKVIVHPETLKTDVYTDITYPALTTESFTTQFVMGRTSGNNQFFPFAADDYMLYRFIGIPMCHVFDVADVN